MRLSLSPSQAQRGSPGVTGNRAQSLWLLYICVCWGGGGDVGSQTVRGLSKSFGGDAVSCGAIS